MNPQFSPLFTPLTLNNGVVLKNRLAVAPMTHYASHEDGTLSQQEAHFLQNRAADFGLFITAATLVCPNGKAFFGQPKATDDAHLPSLQKVAELIKNQGAKAILQIHHGGRLAEDALLNSLDKVAPSNDEATGARALTEDEIHAIIGDFAKAAERALLAGFDGVEIHGANNYLLQQFISTETNRRTDAWGGSIQNRLRFSLAIIDAVDAVRQKHARADFVIGYRFSPEEPYENGLTMTDTFALIDALVKKPLQYLHVSLWDFYKKARRGADTNHTRMQLIHERIGGQLPLIGVGNLLTAEAVLTAYQTGWAECIAVGKAVMVNPDFATLIKTGRENQIQARLDPTRTDQYGIPDNLWQKCQQGGAWLPPLIGKDWQPVDV